MKEENLINKMNDNELMIETVYSMHSICFSFIILSCLVSCNNNNNNNNNNTL